MTTVFRLNRRRFLATTAIVTGAAMLPFSSTLWAAGAARKGGTLRISVDQAVGMLNPLLARVNPEYLLSELLYNGLTRLSHDMQAEPDLATSWSHNEALTEWTFSLRDNLLFHDGSRCTSRDVVASLQAILDPKTASPGLRNIGPIKSVEAIDELHVKLTTTMPYADLPISLAYPDAKIVPAAIVQGDMARLTREAVGTGPFKLASFEPERLVVVTRNEQFHDPERPFLDRVEIRVYPDPTAESSALMSGDIDLMLSAQATEFSRLGQASGVTGLRAPSGQFLNINMACDQKPFNDVRVRQALSLCVDRAALVDFVAEGFGTPGNDTPLNAAYRYHADIELRQADIAKARELLADAGYPDGLDITLVASDKPSTRTQLGIAVREMAKPAGFNIKVETMANSTYLDQVWKKGNFYVGFYNMQPSADAVFSLLYTSDAAWNETRWNNSEFDAAVAGARGTDDSVKRAALYGTAQRLMHEQVPSLIPTFFDVLAAQRNYVQGYRLHPRGAVFRLDQAWLDEGAPKRG
ncbi:MULTISPECIES: ABC transporter substrate-binding protein [Pseudomonas]|uniref:ABC transporter substrate-binding protein n=1 Tax=Pseudomonas TaxID=286 RepID=UPI00257B0ED7|nr:MULTISPECIES: ABC transporter substrate-binding protein [Pseudomonas]